MAASYNTPSLLLLKEGRFIEQIHAQTALDPPKTIHYRHTIRMLPGQCSHQNEMTQLKVMYHNRLIEKDLEIERLRQILKEKGENKHADFDKQNDVQPQLKYLIPPENYKIDISRIEVNGISQVSFGMNESILTNATPRRISQFEHIFHHEEKEPSDNEQVLKVKKQMRSTMEVLSNITDMLNKPRKKYEFYNVSLEKQLEQAEKDVYKKLDQTSLQLYQQNNRCNETFIEHLQPSKEDSSQYLDDYDQDLDQTDEQDGGGKDTLSFIQGAVKQHEILKQALIDLEQSTRKQFEDMKNYYENEIQQYIEILNHSQTKESKGAYNLNSTRSNIQKQKQEDNDSEEEVTTLRREQKFEIIFPEEDDYIVEK